MSATSTLPAARSQRPRFGLVAARTAKTFRPAQAEQILPAGLLAAESSFEFRQCPRIVLHQLFHEPPHYLLWLPESSGYPILVRNHLLIPPKRFAASSTENNASITAA